MPTKKFLPPLPRLARAAPVVLLCLLAACTDQALYSQLSERQANEMVALLRSAGIDADKQAQDGQFSILTSPSDFSAAVRLLSAQGYPRETFDSMGKVFKREGFVSSPLEERARLQHAMSQEISNTIASIDGVVTARVHLVVPERNPLADKPEPAAAAVFIKHRLDVDLGSQITQIKAMVVNSVEGLSYDSVTVALFPSEAIAGTEAGKPSAAGATPQQAAMFAPLLSGAAAGSLALVGGALLWWRRREGRIDAAIARLPALPGPRPERPVADTAADFGASLRRAEGKQ